MCGETFPEILHKRLPAEWKMQPRRPSAANDKGRYLISPQSGKKHSRRGDLPLSVRSGEVISLGSMKTAINAARITAVYHAETFYLLQRTVVSEMMCNRVITNITLE